MTNCETIVLKRRIEDGPAEASNGSPTDDVEDYVLQTAPNVVINGDDDGVTAQHGTADDVTLLTNAPRAGRQYRVDNGRERRREGGMERRGEGSVCV